MPIGKIQLEKLRLDRPCPKIYVYYLPKIGKILIRQQSKD